MLLPLPVFHSSQRRSEQVLLLHPGFQVPFPQWLLVSGYLNFLGFLKHVLIKFRHSEE